MRELLLQDLSITFRLQNTVTVNDTPFLYYLTSDSVVG